jgi:hypothetical protein
MARQHFKLVQPEDQRQDLEQRFRRCADTKDHTGVVAELLATHGDVGWRDGAHFVDYAEPTFQDWIGQSQTGGVRTLLAFRRTPDGWSSETAGDLPLWTRWHHCHGRGYGYVELEEVECRNRIAVLSSGREELALLFLEQLAATEPQAEHLGFCEEVGFNLSPVDACLASRAHPVILRPCSSDINPVELIWNYSRGWICKRVLERLKQLIKAWATGLRPFMIVASRVMAAMHA